MKSILIPIAALAIGFVAGFVLKSFGSPQAHVADVVADRGLPAYLIGAARITDYERLPEYRAVAEPLARRAGYEVIAAGQTGTPSAVLLEGHWPAEGLLFVERYDSMESLLRFANSEEFQQAKALRNEVAEVSFMIGLRAGEPPELEH